jgi:hypothetical protein
LQEHRLQAESGRTAADTRRWILTPDADGGFRLGERGMGSWTARPAPDGWTVEGTAIGSTRLAIRRSEAGPWRRTLVGGLGSGEAELGGTLPDRDDRPGALLLSDGRLFRLALRGPLDPRWELSGAFRVGAYLVARPAGGDVWTIEAGPAGCELPGLESVLILLAAELRAAGAGVSGASGPNER